MTGDGFLTSVPKPIQPFVEIPSCAYGVPRNVKLKPMSTGPP